MRKFLAAPIRIARRATKTVVAVYGKRFAVLCAGCTTLGAVGGIKSLMTFSRAVDAHLGWWVCVPYSIVAVGTCIAVAFGRGRDACVVLLGSTALTAVVVVGEVSGGLCPSPWLSPLVGGAVVFGAFVVGGALAASVTATRVAMALSELRVGDVVNVTLNVHTFTTMDEPIYVVMTNPLLLASERRYAYEDQVVAECVIAFTSRWIRWMQWMRPPERRLRPIEYGEGLLSRSKANVGIVFVVDLLLSDAKYGQHQEGLAIRYWHTDDYLVAAHRLTVYARRIQRAWRRAISDPAFAVCVGRLKREYGELQGGLKRWQDTL